MPSGCRWVLLALPKLPLEFSACQCPNHLKWSIYTSYGNFYMIIICVCVSLYNIVLSMAVLMGRLPGTGKCTPVLTAEGTYLPLPRRQFGRCFVGRRAGPHTGQPLALRIYDTPWCNPKPGCLYSVYSIDSGCVLANPPPPRLFVPYCGCGTVVRWYPCHPSL
jgi:hypothetical protein